MTKFIGRKKELGLLSQLKDKSTASLIVIKGRRRVGKSRLLEEFANSFKRAYVFSGLSPRKEMIAQTQRDEFVKQYKRQFKKSIKEKDDWGDLFWELSKQVKTGSVLVVLDEITWMAHDDPDFLGKLKNAWDLYFKKNDKLVLALCGSVSAWIDKNILNSTGFLGRESLALNLEEMPLKDCMEFWGGEDGRVSIYEKIKVLAVTGGIPRYLESINSKLTAEKNIEALCFKETGLLFNEFEKIFSDIFGTKSEFYKEIMIYLCKGASTLKGITAHLGLQKSGDVSDYLNDLIKSGFISRDFTWKAENGKFSNLSHYRIKDNYSRFYLRYILPRKEQVKVVDDDFSLVGLEQWSIIMGLQVENLILSNRREIKQLLQINPGEVVADNPYFQNKTARQQGCQIDYMIQTKHNVLYVCEIRFSKHPVGPKAIEDVKQKIKRIKMPKQFSYRPVLIHVNGVSEVVEDSQYFSNIIDFSEIISSP